MNDTVLAPGRVAVITGAASGIGLAAAMHFASLGMRLVLADTDEAGLEKALTAMAAKTNAASGVIAMPTDVGRREDVIRLRDRAYDAFGEVGLLMNNAGREGGGDIFGEAGRWEDILGTNLAGVINGVQVFGPAMIAQGTPGAIINTGSKQGITCPPGDTAYNVSKAGVKVVTEALAHELRTRKDCRVTAHLLVPGFTFTGLTRVRVAQKPPAAWTPEQVVEFMVEKLAQGDFYIICPDNDVTRDLDNARVIWAAMDITENRPPLSRWHPDYAPAFAAFLAERGL
ncbi:SDR family NAD(P)-dependent oxidoreductase [Acidisoma cladoniae]|jgi:NAD(P)-dependent dehydrogenase (short-subunit alcohol dehydrogenase family)|uniref:SDR family NAD(P)-dependent oxidoreductase n=1 Tax=Acidisoma cladoniae TaxID=3040935 RepID=UPI00254E877B|nr:SDR family NAD(P)-dependent oxidoreductase [Acidisoma sp. PAMC 29798]